MRTWSDRRNGRGQSEVDRVVVVPLAVMDLRVSQRRLALQVGLRQRWSLVGQLILGADDGESTSESLLAQAFSALCPSEAAADDNDAVRMRHNGSCS